MAITHRGLYRSSLSRDRAETPDLATLDDMGRQVQAEDTDVILCTSGTTGDPREVAVPLLPLLAEVDRVQKIRARMLKPPVADPLA